MGNYIELFQIPEKVCIVTGGSGLIGKKHGQAILEGKGIPILLDISEERLFQTKKELETEYPGYTVETFLCDITNKADLETIRDVLIKKYGSIYGLINNAANNPKMEDKSKNLGAIKFPDFPLDIWNADLNVGLTGAMLCCQVFGEVMEQEGKGVVINIGSDYGIIAPDQRIYRKDGVPENQQIIKPVSYSIVKHGIIGLTKYLSVYWAPKGIRVNTLCPASLENGQDEEFIKKLTNLIPMGRMSRPEEYICTVLYMLSDASSYMTGSTILLDGGRTSW